MILKTLKIVQQLSGGTISILTHHRVTRKEGMDSFLDFLLHLHRLCEFLHLSVEHQIDHATLWCWTL